MPIPNGTQNFLEIRYKAKYQAMPPFLKGGETFMERGGGEWLEAVEV